MYFLWLFMPKCNNSFCFPVYLIHTPTLSLSFTHAHTPTLSLIHTRTHTHSLSLIHTRTHQYIHVRLSPHSYTLSVSHTECVSIFNRGQPSFKIVEQFPTQKQTRTFGTLLQLLKIKELQEIKISRGTVAQLLQHPFKGLRLMQLFY